MFPNSNPDFLQLQLYWVAVKENKASYHTSEDILFTTYPYYKVKFLNSDPENIRINEA